MALHFGLWGSLVPHHLQLSQGYGSQHPFLTHGCFTLIPGVFEYILGVFAVFMQFCG